MNLELFSLSLVCSWFKLVFSDLVHQTPSAAEKCLSHMCPALHRVSVMPTAGTLKT